MWKHFSTWHISPHASPNTCCSTFIMWRTFSMWHILFIVKASKRSGNEKNEEDFPLLWIEFQFLTKFNWVSLPASVVIKAILILVICFHLTRSRKQKKKWSALCIYICLLLRSTYHECKIVTCPYFGLRVSFLRAMPSFYKIHHPRHRAKVSQNDSHNMLRKQ